MKRLLIIALVVAIGPWVVIGVVRALGEDEAERHYTVRAVFDNASTLVGGEEVKVAGAGVGEVTGMDVTEDNKAAVSMRIDNDGFTPFKANARCEIRLQGLIGERFVECEPGSANAPALRRIDDGDGEGEHLLAATGTSSPVDLDLITNVMRLPFRERFRIVLSEFGAGLAGRGEELNEVIHRANPALRETEQLVRILAQQNRTLVRLAEDSDRALAPLAAEREHVADFIVQANVTGEATAERSDDLRRGINRLPAFLAELRPLMADLQGFSDEATPVVGDLGRAAPDLARLIRGQGELAQAGRESLPSLGDSLERGGPALIAARPLIRNLGRLGRQVDPVAKNLDLLTASLDETGGVERLMDLLYFSTLSINGFDAIGHYLRAGLVTNTCSNYTLTLSQGCNATFDTSAAAAGAAANAPAPDLDSGGSVPATPPLLRQLAGTGETAAQARQRERNLDALRQRAEQGAPDTGDPALEYLLGGER